MEVDKLPFSRTVKRLTEYSHKVNNETQLCTRLTVIAPGIAEPIVETFATDAFTLVIHTLYGTIIRN